MKFTDKTKKIICICVAIAMVIPIALSIAYTFMGVCCGRSAV